MIIKKNMNVNMEVTPEIVVEFFKEATYDEIMTTYNGMPREVRSEIASHFLSDLASTDMDEYRRFIGDSKPEYSEIMNNHETTKTPETPKDVEDTKSSKDDEEEFKVGDLYKWGDRGYIALEIIDVTDDYIKLKPSTISNPFISLLSGYYISENDLFNETDTIRKDVFRFMLRTKLIEKVK